MATQGRWVLEIVTWDKGDPLGVGSPDAVTVWRRYRTRREAKSAAQSIEGCVILRDALTGEGRVVEHNYAQLEEGMEVALAETLMDEYDASRAPAQEPQP